MKHGLKRVLAVLLALAMAVPSNVLADSWTRDPETVEQTEAVLSGETTIEKQGDEAQEAELTIQLSATRADYDGTNKRPTVTVKSGGTDVTNHENTSIKWEKDGVELSANAEFIEVGMYNLTVTYESATKTATFQIGRAKIGDMEVDISDQAYTGFAIIPDPSDVTFTDSYGTTHNVTYEITSITNNTNVGQASVGMSGTGNFIGSANAKFNIVPASFDNVQINTVGQSFVIGNGQFVPELVSIKLGEYSTFVKAEEVIKWIYTAYMSESKGFKMPKDGEVDAGL